MTSDPNMIMDRVFYWDLKTVRDRHRYVPKGAPHSPVSNILVDSKGFLAVGRVPKHIRVRITVLPDDYVEEKASKEKDEDVLAAAVRGVSEYLVNGTPVTVRPGEVVEVDVDLGKAEELLAQ